MRPVLLIAGLLAMAVGGLWIGQGLGLIVWPAESFMIAQVQWAWYGAIVVAVGLALIGVSRRR